MFSQTEPFYGFHLLDLHVRRKAETGNRYFTLFDGL